MVTMALADLITTERIALLAEPVDRDSVLDAAARLLADAAPHATTTIADSLRQRERLGSTAIGHGVAIPHGRSKAFGDARGAFLRLLTPVEFDAADGEPVDLVFAIAVPEGFSQQHLQLLSELAERFADSGFRERLRRAGDAGALCSTLLGADAQAAR